MKKEDTANRIWKRAGEDWTEDETTLALFVYCLVPYSKIRPHEENIVRYGELLERGAGSLKAKIYNLASLDPAILSKNQKGMGNSSAMDKVVWNKYHNNLDALLQKVPEIIEGLKKKYQKNSISIDEPLFFNENMLSGKVGENVERVVKTRLNQDFFRRVVLSSYLSRCAITQIKIPDLLVASHIIPWSDDETNRLNPENGICLNSLHDRAFDRGLITIDQNFCLRISKRLQDEYSLDFINTNFKKYENKPITLPERFSPSKEFLQYHNDVIFQG